MRKRLIICIALSFSLVACQKASDLQETVPATDKGSAALQTKALNTPEDINMGSVIVRLDRSFIEKGDFSALESLSGVTEVLPVFPSTPGKEELEKKHHLDCFYEVKLSEGTTPVAAAARLADLGAVLAIEYDKNLSADRHIEVVPADDIPLTKASSVLPFNDPRLPDQWHLVNGGAGDIARNNKAGADINVLEAWSLTAGDPSIIVAVVDEGVNYKHPDLAGAMWTDKDGNHGKNFVTNGPITWNNPEDTGHGSHCAGIIGAVNNNGIGISSVAGGSGKGDGVKIMSCQIFDGKTSTMASTARAIKYAGDNGASVISCSFGYSGAGFASDDAFVKYAGAEIEAVKYFEDCKNNSVLDGGIAVFSAGNNAEAYCNYPGAYRDFISVSAFAPDFLPASYTNYGYGSSIVAPGGDFVLGAKAGVLSCLNNDAGYGYMNGTSQSCPHVSGIVALGLSYAKKLGKKFTKEEFKSLLITSVNEMDSRLTGTRNSINLGQYRKLLGSGSIDTWKFLMAIEGTPSVIIKTGEDTRLSLSSFFGTGAQDFVTYLDIEVSDTAKQALGLETDPTITHGRLNIKATKSGCAKITIHAIGSGDRLGDGTNIGGMEITRDISIISRPVKSSNGGWL